FRGINAFRAMLDVGQALRGLETEIAQRRSAFNIAPDAARRSVLLLGGELSGGHNFNVVPDRVSFTLDRRTNPEEDFGVERARLFAVIAESCDAGVKCEVEVLQEG